MKIVKFNNEYYKQVNEIYKASFPTKERYSSLKKLISNIKNNYAEMNCLIENKNIFGFIYSIKYKDMLFILYLAINENVRSCGYGSYLLKDYLEKYKDYFIYLNIDKVDSSFKDYEIRKKRLQFYEKNNLYLTEYLSIEKEGDFNILSNKKEINIKEYELLDEFITKLLGGSKSNIFKI